MKKGIACVICMLMLLALASPASANPFAKQWYWIKDRLEGKVKTIKEKAGTNSYISHYDEKGKLLTEEALDAKGAVQLKAELDYGPNGLEQITMLDGDGRRLWVETAQYAKGKIVFVERSGVWNKARFHYDENGNLKEIVTVRPSGEDGEKWVYGYDKDGRLIETYRVTMNGFKNARRTMAYNEEGDLKERILYSDVDGALAQKRIYTYTYDKSGNWTFRTMKAYGFGEDKGREAELPVTRQIEYYK